MIYFMLPCVNHHKIEKYAFAILRQGLICHG
jgi:hypothetical protein